MSIGENIINFIKQYFTITSVNAIDIIEMLIIAVVFYYILIWIKKTRAWALFKGIMIIVIVMILAALFQFNTILWIARNTISVGIIGIIIIFQPELRRALEQIGGAKFFKNLFGTSKDVQIISDDSINEIIAAVYAMARDKTGALICLENDISLEEYEITGIRMDSDISRQLLLNIFVNKTPLHDGAVIIRDDRIQAATCYLPMSDNLKLNKKYGTRHRAGVGLSEVTDAFVIIVSEETGQVSVALGGELIEDVGENELNNRMHVFQRPSKDGKLVKKMKNRRKGDES